MTAWLEKEPRGFRGSTLFIFYALNCHLLWLSAMHVVGMFPGDDLWMARELLDSFSTDLIVMMYAVPIVEEFKYRFVLLPIAVLFYRWSGRAVGIVTIVVVSSYQFGCDHGNLRNVLSQGVLGLILCLVFLKCGGMRGFRGWPKALLCTMLAHWGWNTLILTLMILWLLVMT